MSILANLLGRKNNKEQRKIRVRLPNFTGDESRDMTVQELQQEYKDYLIIDPKIGEQVDMKKLANLEIDEVVAMPPIQGGSGRLMEIGVKRRVLCG